MEDKKLEDVYSGEHLRIVRGDLKQAKTLINSWLKGEAIDPDLLNFMAMMFGSMVNDFPQDI